MPCFNLIQYVFQFLYMPKIWSKIMDKKLKKFELIDFLHMFFIVAMPIICVGGVSLIPHKLRLPLIYMTGIILLAAFVFGRKKVKLNSVNVSGILLLCYLFIQLTYSYDQQATLDFFIIYACATTLLFIDLPLNNIEKIITVMYVFCIVIAISIIISVPIKNCMLTYFNFIVNPNNTPSVRQAILNELSIGSYSGFAREKGEAAFIMNIGLAISFSKFFTEGKLNKKDIVAFLLMFSALILTSKRTMLTVSLICFVVFMIVSKIKGKFFKFACIVLVAVFVLFFILMFMPDFANVFNRFMDKENMESMGSRDLLWIYMEMMLSKYWLFGAGFASYNEFAYDNGFRNYKERWDYHGHNSYYQALSETGIIGFTIIIAFLLFALLKTIKYIRTGNLTNSQMKIIFFSLYVQIMVDFYAITGNPFYTNQIIFMLFFAIGIMLYVGMSTEDKARTKISTRGIGYE